MLIRYMCYFMHNSNSTYILNGLNASVDPHFDYQPFSRHL